MKVIYSREVYKTNHRISNLPSLDVINTPHHQLLKPGVGSIVVFYYVGVLQETNQNEKDFEWHQSCSMISLTPKHRKEISGL